MRWPAGVLAAALVLAAPAAAEAVAAPAEIASALAVDPLYVDADVAGAFTATEAGELRERLRTATTPVYLAVLPDPGSPSPGPSVAPSVAPLLEPSPTATAAAPGTAAAIAAAAGRPGTYGVVSGTDFRAVSTLVDDRAAELAETALDAVRDGADTVTALLEFVDQVELAVSQAHDDTPARTDDGAGRPLDGRRPWLVAFAAVAALAATGMVLRRR